MGLGTVMMFAGVWWALCALPLLLGGILLLLRGYKRVRAVLGRLSLPEHRAIMLRNYSEIRMVSRLVCLMAAIICFCIALLRPQYAGADDTTVRQELSRDVLILIDISRSMLSPDVAVVGGVGNRLEAAQKKIKQLVTQLSAERIGLIIFSGAAFVQCPLTKDFETLRLFLDSLSAETVSRSTTALDAPLKKALELFERDTGRKQKLMIMVTDGEDFSGSLDAMIETARASNVHLCVLGVGTNAGGPIPRFNEQGVYVDYERDGNGTISMSRLHEPTLRALAAKLSGIYIRMHEHDDVDIAQIVNLLRRFDREEHATTSPHSVMHETFMYWTMAGLVFCMLGWCL